MIKLENGTGNFLLNGIPYPKGKYRIRILGSMVGLHEIGNQVEVAGPTIFSNWVNAADVPYASVAALRADLRTFIFTG